MGERDCMGCYSRHRPLRWSERVGMALCWVCRLRVRLPFLLTPVVDFLDGANSRRPTPPEED